MQELEQMRQEQMSAWKEIPPWMRLRDWATLGLPLWDMTPPHEILAVMALLMQEAARNMQMHALAKLQE